MSTNRKSTMIAVALLSAAVTFLVCYGQVRTAQKQAESARAERDWAFFKGQHSALADIARLNSAQLSLNVLQKSMFNVLEAGQGRHGFPQEALRRLHKQIAAAIPGAWEQFALLQGRAYIDGTEYDLPPKYEKMSGTYGPPFTVRQTDHNKKLLHTLTLPHGKIVWDGVDFGPVPAKGRVQLGAGGVVLVNNVLRTPERQSR